MLTFAEAIDQHEILLRPELKMDGQVRPQDWSDAPVLTDFSAFVKNNDKQEFFFCRPADQTRVRVSAGRDNLYLLVTCMGTTTAASKATRSASTPPRRSRPSPWC